MALNPSTNATMSGRITAADGNYPYGSSKDETAPAAGDGTPYFKARADDIFGFQQALLKSAGIVPSGNAETAVASQYSQALVELMSGRAFNYDDSGAADAYVLSVQTDQHAPASLFDGLAAWFFPANTNTGASTVNLVGLGVVNIKLPGGVTDPSAGQIEASRLTKLTYRTAPSAHFELDLTGTMQTTIFTAGGVYTPPPGVKSLRFTVIGGGGGSGGIDGQGAGTQGCSCPGAGGASSILTTENIDPSYTIVIGAGGTGGAGSGGVAGTDGGNTSVVSTNTNIVANGGFGGPGDTATSGNSVGSGVDGGTATGGDVNIQGSGTALYGTSSGTLLASLSGASILGGGVRARSGNTGVNAVTPGAGAGACAVINATTNYSGGDGADGIVIIEEFF